MAEQLVREYREVKPLIRRLGELAEDHEFLGQFRSGFEFVEWFKAFISPVLRINYNAGAYWIRKTDLRGVVLWTKQGAWNEWAANAVLARAVTDFRDYIEPEFIPLLSHQMADEARHFYLRSKTLALTGESLVGFKPLGKWVELFEFPLRCAAERLERPYFQAKFSGAFQTVELTATVQHRGVVENAHFNKALWEGPGAKAAEALVNFSREIEDDEAFHWSIAERAWAKYAKSPEAMRNILECAAEALRVATEARVRRVELAEKRAI